MTTIFTAPNAAHRPEMTQEERKVMDRLQARKAERTATQKLVQRLMTTPLGIW